jgi:hypothetical protein
MWTYQNVFLFRFRAFPQRGSKFWTNIILLYSLNEYLFTCFFYFRWRDFWNILYKENRWSKTEERSSRNLLHVILFQQWSVPNQILKERILLKPPKIYHLFFRKWRISDLIKIYSAFILPNKCKIFGWWNENLVQWQKIHGMDNWRKSDLMLILEQIVHSLAQSA